MMDRIMPGAPTMTPQEFIQIWRNSRFGESQGATSFFDDICRLVGHPRPADIQDPEDFTFEKKVLGGVADAYKAGHFAWEFKGTDRQLPGAFDQLLRYQVYLKTPPLLVVSSFSLIRVQTNFPGKETVVHDIPIAELGDPEQLRQAARHILRSGGVRACSARLRRLHATRRFAVRADSGRYGAARRWR